MELSCEGTIKEDMLARQKPGRSRTIRWFCAVTWFCGIFHLTFLSLYLIGSVVGFKIWLRIASSRCTLQSPVQQPFSHAELAMLWKHFLANINVDDSGAVAASRGFGSFGDSYFYHWSRDAALAMETLVLTGNLSKLDKTLMDKWLHFEEGIKKHYPTLTPNGVDVHVEVKFEIPNGRPYNGGWCRPQNDGAALRAKTAALYGLVLLRVGDVSRAEVVWVQVVDDLDYMSQHFKDETCDIWEWRRRNDFFWNQYVTRAALFIGSQFARKLPKPDLARARHWEVVALSMNSDLAAYFDGSVVRPSHETQIDTQVDTSVLEAFNEGDYFEFSPLQRLYTPLDPRVIQSLIFMTEQFCGRFQINQDRAHRGYPGVLYGRFLDDPYGGGNPWVFLSASAAGLLYRMAEEAALQPRLAASSASLLNKLLKTPDATWRQDRIVELIGAGDGILAFMKELTPDMHFAEQLDRVTGKARSAKDLTWSYANLLKALAYRSSALSALHKR